MTGKIETVYVYLPEEAVDCWAPRRGEHVRDDIYRLIDDEPEDPVFEFKKGDLVHCGMKTLDAGIRKYEEHLVAFKKAI